MLLTPTFQVYLGDIYNNTNKQDIIAETCISSSLVVVTVIYSIWLENKEPRRIIFVSLIIVMVSYCLSVYVFAEVMYQWYIVGLIQATFLDTVYKMLMWLPAYVLVTKMIPHEVETILNAFVKTL